jgi:cell division protease FtsH
VFTTEEAPPAFSSKTVEAIDAEVQELLTSSYNRAKEILTENKDKLELLAKTLFEKESMDGRDVEKLLGIEKKSEDEEDVEQRDEQEVNPPLSEANV